MKLASIEKIKAVVNHPNADLLDVVTILNYQAVVKRGEFQEGQLAIFIQPDTILPETEWSKPFKAKSNRIKAIKLRNIWSMGVVLPINILKNYGDLV